MEQIMPNASVFIQAVIFLVVASPERRHEGGAIEAEVVRDGVVLDHQITQANGLIGAGIGDGSLVFVAVGHDLELDLALLVVLVWTGAPGSEDGATGQEVHAFSAGLHHHAAELDIGGAIEDAGQAGVHASLQLVLSLAQIEAELRFELGTLIGDVPADLEGHRFVVGHHEAFQRYGFITIRAADSSTGPAAIGALLELQNHDDLAARCVLLITPLAGNPILGLGKGCGGQDSQQGEQQDGLGPGAHTHVHSRSPRSRVAGNLG